MTKRKFKPRQPHAAKSPSPDITEILFRALIKLGIEQNQEMAKSLEMDSGRLSNLVLGKEGLTLTQRKNLAELLRKKGLTDTETEFVARILRVEKPDAEDIEKFVFSRGFFSDPKHYCGDYCAYSPVLPWINRAQEQFEMQKLGLSIRPGKEERTYIFDFGRNEYDDNKSPPIYTRGAVLFASDRLFLIGYDAVYFRDLTLFILYRHSDDELYGLATFSRNPYCGARRVALHRARLPSLSPAMIGWLQNSDHSSGVLIEPLLNSTQSTDTEAL